MQVRFQIGVAHYNGNSIRTNFTPDTNPAPPDNYMAISVERTQNSPKYRQYYLQAPQVSAEIMDAHAHDKAIVTETVEEGKRWFLSMNPTARTRQNTVSIDLIV